MPVRHHRNTQRESSPRQRITDPPGRESHQESAVKAVGITIRPNALLSSERLLGHPSNGFRDWENRLVVLSELFPAARVIIGFRRQDTALESMFKHAMAKKYPGTLEEYIGLKASTRSTTRRESLFQPTDYRSLDYAAIIGGYQLRLGFENVLALPFEMLVETPETFCVTIAECIGGKLQDTGYAAVNTGLSKAGYYYHAFRHRVGLGAFSFKLIDRIAARVSGPATPMTKKVHEIVLAHHRSSNERLCELVGLDLRRYGYA